jgi:hypothetical protein
MPKGAVFEVSQAILRKAFLLHSAKWVLTIVPYRLNSIFAKN